MKRYVHGFVNGKYTLVSPGDPVPDWVKNPDAYGEIEVPDEEPDTAPEPEDDESEDDAVDDAVTKKPTTQRRKRAPKAEEQKAAEPTLADRAAAAGVEVDPDWTEAELEAAVTLAE